MIIQEISDCFKAISSDILKNKVFVVTAAAELLIYLILNMLLADYKSDIWWFCYTIYLYYFAVQLPILLYNRFNDKGRSIIKNVIENKLSRRVSYTAAYIMTIIVFFEIRFILLNIFSAILALLLHKDQFVPIRNVQLAVSNVPVIMIIVSLFFSILAVVKKYNIAVMVYLIVSLLLIMNRYNMFLSMVFPYSEGCYASYLAGKCFMTLLSIGVVIILNIRKDG